VLSEGTAHDDLIDGRPGAPDARGERQSEIGFTLLRLQPAPAGELAIDLDRRWAVAMLLLHRLPRRQGLVTVDLGERQA